MRVMRGWLILLVYHNFKALREFGRGWNIRGDMNKIKNLSGKSEALIPVRICVSIFRKSYLNVSKNGFRLALYRFNSDNCTQLMVFQRLDFLYRTKNSTECNTIRRLKRIWKLESLRSWTVHYSCSHYSLFCLFFHLLILLLIFLPFTVYFLKVLITAV